MSDSPENPDRLIFDNPPIRVKHCRRGPMMYLARDQYMGRSLDLYGESSELEFELFGQFLKPGMIVVDAGAHIGTHTIYFAHTVGPAVVPGARLGAGYWWRNVRERVQFLAAVREAAALGVRCFIEIGPRGLLFKHIADSVADLGGNFATVSVLNTNDPDCDPCPAAIAKAIVAGARIETDVAFGADPGGTVPLPHYPWQQKRFHYAPTVEAIGVTEGQRHPLAGARYTADALDWHCHVDTVLLPPLADHKLGEQVLLPGTAFVEIATCIARQWFACESVVISNFEILKALDLSGGQTSELMARVSPASNTLDIFSRPRLSNAAWVLNCRCEMLRGGAQESIAVPPCPEMRAVGDKEFFYRFTAANGLPYGPAFQLARDIEASSGNAFISVELEPSDEATPYVVDPMRLDCCTQGVLLVLPDVDAERRGVTYIPVRIDEITVLRRGIPHRALIEVVSKGERAIVANYFVHDSSGALLIVLRAARCQAVPTRRPVSLEAAGLVELPQLLDGSLTAGGGGAAVGVADVLAWVRALTSASADTAPDNAVRLLEGWAVAASYEIATALAADSRIDPDLLVASGRLSGELRNWFVNLLIQLEAAGLAKREDDGWLLHQEAFLPTSASVIALLARELPSRAGELLVASAISAWVARISAERIASMPSDPLLSSAVLDFFEASSVSVRRSGEMLSRLVESLDGFWPGNRALRILQIGVGAVPALLRTNSSDRSLLLSVFESDRRRLENARSALTRAGNVSFIETIAAIQPQSYDLIVSAEGLHSRDPGVTLGVLRKALAARGLLIAIEPLPSLFRDLAFGTEVNWFERGAADLPIGRLAPPRAWRSDLLAAGFARAEAIALGSAAEASALIVAETENAESSLGHPLQDQGEPRSVMIVDQTDTRELELSATLSRLLLADPRTRLVTAETFDKSAYPDVVVHFPNSFDDATGPAASLSARCFDLKACADSIGRKGTTLWYVFFGALGHEQSKVRPVEAGAWAFARTIANEYPHLDVRRIDVLPHITSHFVAERIRDILLSGTDETELQIDANALRAVRVGSVRRAIGNRAASANAATTAISLTRQSGAARRLRWQAVERTPPAANQVEIEVEATGVNFRDLMWMLSLLPDEILESGMSGPTMGLECAGRVVRAGSKVKHLAVGDRVVALTAAGFATHVTVPAAHAVLLPGDISSEAGATIPVAFFTAYYALNRLAQLRRDEWVLIHGGAGGVGLAAIQIAQARGAQIVATAGSPAKRALLRALGVAHVLELTLDGLCRRRARDHGDRRRCRAQQPCRRRDGTFDRLLAAIRPLCRVGQARLRQQHASRSPAVPQESELFRSRHGPAHGEPSGFVREALR